VLRTIEHQDRPYALWRKGEPDDAGLEKMLNDVPDLDLFVRFVELDGSTEGKTRDPVHWFHGELERRGRKLPQRPRV
jgi:hypothetical protein